MNFYNEIDAGKSAWLLQLIHKRVIVPGSVCEESIVNLKPDDLAGYQQCHFFAGIGIWSYALRLAGWKDEWPVWTGSCPCQPFSVAGKRKSQADERHLWPAWFRLIAERRPVTIFGEQVNDLAWLDLVIDDFESIDYEVIPMEIPASSAGAPHRRQRLYFGAHPKHTKANENIAPTAGRVLAEMHKVWCRQTNDRVLHRETRPRRETLLVQGLRQKASDTLFAWADSGAMGGAESTPQDSQDERAIGSLTKPSEATSDAPDRARPKESEEKRTSVRSPGRQQHEADSGEDQQRDMRVDGREAGHNIVQGAQPSGSVTRPDSAEQGLPLQQHQNSLPCDQLRLGALGGGNPDGNNTVVEGDINDKSDTDGKSDSGTPGCSDEHTVQSSAKNSQNTKGSSGVDDQGDTAPHGRHRSFFVADADEAGSQGRGLHGATEIRSDSNGQVVGAGSVTGELEHASCDGRQQRGSESGGRRVTSGRGPCNGFWSDAQWLPCTDGKARAAKSSPQSLVDGFAADILRDCNNGFPLSKGSEARTLRLKGYGDGIVAPVAAEFIKAYLEIINT